PGRDVALDHVGPVSDHVLRAGVAARDVVQALHRGRVERVHRQLGREVRRGVDQGVGDGLAGGRDAGDLVAVYVRLHGGRGGARAEFGEAVAEGLVTDDQALEVRQAAERLDRVARALEAEHRVGRGDLPRRAGVPHRAGPDRHRDGLAAIGDRGRPGGQIREGLRGPGTGDSRICVQTAYPRALAQGADRVVADVVVHEVHFALAEHVQGAALL